MASVFLSYVHEDAKKAASLARSLEQAGHRVWWDEQIRGGSQYSKEIEQALSDADAVVVLWSKLSTNSEWVRDEAAAGRDQGKLIPVQLENVEPPIGFRQIQSIDLAGWRGRGNALALRKLTEAVAALVGKDEAVAPSPVSARESPRRPYSWAAALAVLAALAAGLLLLRPFEGQPTSPLVAVIAADQSAASQALASDLLVKLGGLQDSDSAALRLADSDYAERPDLILEVAKAAAGQEHHASLTLRNGRDGTLLWAKQFGDRQTQAGDLEHQLAYGAASLLACAQEGKNDASLNRQLLKQYLRTCSELATTTSSVANLRQSLIGITQEAPKFVPAWEKLILLESAMAPHASGSGRKSLLVALKEHIAAVRKVNKDMAAASLGEVELLSFDRILLRLQLLDRVVEQYPDSVPALRRRAFALFAVGRHGEAVFDIRRAADLDPLSGPTREDYVIMLFYAGLTDAAFGEFATMERQWRGSNVVANARHHLATPDEGLENLRRAASQLDPRWKRVLEAGLLARIDPSPQKIDRAVSEARAILKTYPETGYLLAQYLGQFGKHDELFELIFRQTDHLAKAGIRDVIFRPVFAGFWREPRSMRAAKHLGLVDYWRESGKWPDFCSQPDFPYDCRTEAAKLAR